MSRFLLRLRRFLLGILAIILGLGLAFFLLAFLFIFINFPGNASFPVDCAVVFGSAVHSGTEAGPGITRRIETAVRLVREENVQRLLLTGGTGEGNALSEARVMRNLALKMGMDPAKLMLEEGATSTWQNIQFLLPELKKCSSVVGISDRYHLARIRLIAWRQGISMMTYPADRTSDALFELVALLRETAGVIFYASPFVR